MSEGLSLFLIIYAAGTVGGTIGPLPYGLDECERHAQSMRAQITARLATGRYEDGTAIKANPGMAERAKSMTFTCEYRASRPEIGSKPLAKEQGQ